MSRADRPRITPVDPRRCATLDARIREAVRALADLDSAARPSPSARALSDVALRREAVAAARLDGAAVSLDDLLQLEALPPPSPTFGAQRDRAVEPPVALASRYLDALTLGRRRLETEHAFTTEGLVTVLTELSGLPCPTMIPDAVADAIADIAEAVGDASILRSPIVNASMVERRLAMLHTVMTETRMLSRVVVMLALGPEDRREFCVLPPSVRRLVQRDPVDADATRDSDTEGAAIAHATRLAEDIAAGAADTLRLIERLGSLAAEDNQRICALSTAAHSTQRVHLALQRRPVIALPDLLRETGLHVQAATAALHRLRALGIVRELPRRHRYRVYRYDAYVDLVSEGLT
jgi:hypothetical protein